MATTFDSTKSPTRPRSHQLDQTSIHEFVQDLIGDDLHAQRVRSVSSGVIGVLHAATLAIHAIGEGLAVAEGLDPKHAIKQVDRLLSNRAVDVEGLAQLWLSFVLAERKDIVIALDWTDFDGDEQTTLVLNVITTHGRFTPLLLKAVSKKGLKTRRSDYEDELLCRLRDAVPDDVRVTILADRGFGDQKLYESLREGLGFDYVIRFRGNIRVTSASGEARTATAWLRQDGRLLELHGGA